MNQVSVKRCEARIAKKKAMKKDPMGPAQITDIRYNYLKYWRLVRYYIKREEGINEKDIDMLLYIYSERPFRWDYFNKYDTSFAFDSRRFGRFLQMGYITKYRDNYKNSAGLFIITHKGKKICDTIYKILEGRKKIVFKDKKMFSNRVMARANKIMHEDPTPPEQRPRPTL